MYSFCQTSVEWGKVGELGIDRHDATPAPARCLSPPEGTGTGTCSREFPKEMFSLSSG